MFEPLEYRRFGTVLENESTGRRLIPRRWNMEQRLGGLLWPLLNLENGQPVFRLELGEVMRRERVQVRGVFLDQAPGDLPDPFRAQVVLAKHSRDVLVVAQRGRGFLCDQAFEVPEQ